MMTGFTWILTLFCVAARHLSSASPVLRSLLVVRSGQSVSLTCSLNSSGDFITWFLLHSDRLRPLLTVSLDKFGNEAVNLHSEDERISSSGSLQNGTVELEILQVEEEDAGLYFCSGRCSGGAACFNRGLHLSVDGADGESEAWQPCWTLPICLLPAALVLCVVLVLGFYLCSGKPAGCCNPLRAGRSLRDTEDDSLHYSSLKLAEMPRPFTRAGTRLVGEDVIYSAVANRK